MKMYNEIVLSKQDIENLLQEIDMKQKDIQKLVKKFLEQKKAENKGLPDGKVDKKNGGDPGVIREN